MRVWTELLGPNGLLLSGCLAFPATRQALCVHREHCQSVVSCLLNKCKEGEGCSLHRIWRGQDPKERSAMCKSVWSRTLEIPLLLCMWTRGLESPAR
jgi:hypothetical protein